MALTAERYAELNELCRRFRIDVLTAIHAAQSGHPGGSLSVCEILTYLYQEHMNIDAQTRALEGSRSSDAVPQPCRKGLFPC